MEIPASPTTTLTNQAVSSGQSLTTPSETSAQQNSAPTGGLSQVFAHLLAQVKAQTGTRDGQATFLPPGSPVLMAPAAATPAEADPSGTPNTETVTTDPTETDSAVVPATEANSTASAFYLQTMAPILAAGSLTPNAVQIALPLNSTGGVVAPINAAAPASVASSTLTSIVPAVSINTPRPMPESRPVAPQPEPITGPTQTQAHPVSAASSLSSYLPDNAPSVDAPTVPTVVPPAAQTASAVQQAALPVTNSVSGLNVQNVNPVPQQVALQVAASATTPLVAPKPPVTVASPAPDFHTSGGGEDRFSVPATTAPNVAGPATPVSAADVEAKPGAGTPDKAPTLTNPALPQAAFTVVRQTQTTPESASAKTPPTTARPEAQPAPQTVLPNGKATTVPAVSIERTVAAPIAKSDTPVGSVTMHVDNQGAVEDIAPETQEIAGPIDPQVSVPAEPTGSGTTVAPATTRPNSIVNPHFLEQSTLVNPDKTPTDAASNNPTTTVMSQPVVATHAVSATSAPTVPATDVPVEDAQPENRHIAMARPTKTSPDSTTVALSASPHQASEEEGDAAPSERRDSSDAYSSPHAEPGLGPSAVHAKPAETVSFERSVEKATASQSASQSGHDRVRVVEQVTQKIEALRLTHGRQESTIHLRPDNLGDLRMTIVTDRDRVTAHIVAETAFARQAVEEGRDHLRAALEQKGFSLQGLDVSLNQGSGHNANDRRFSPFEQSGTSQSRSYRTDRGQETVSVAPAASAISNTTPARLNGRLDYTA